MISFLRKNSFLLLLLTAFIAADLLLTWWNPMDTSRRFYKNDFTKTLYHHDGLDHGPVFFGNSAVTGAYMEQDSKSGLIEMGLSYGKLTDLRAILEQGLFRVERELVIGIDVHTMLDPMETDPTYPWFKLWYQPYVYAYRDYFRDTGTELACRTYQAVLRQDALALKGCQGFKETLALPGANPLAYQPRWIDKELYFGRKSDEELQKKWAEYDRNYGLMAREQYKDNLQALDDIIAYAHQHSIPLRVIWMPWHRGYELPPYMPQLQADVNARLQAAGIPVLDKLTGYDPRYLHDLVHLNREEGAPLFTKEVDAWLASLAGSSK